MTLTLGLSGLYHDSAACLVSDGEIVAAIQEERLTRIKNDSSFPFNAISTLMSLTDTKPKDLDAIGWYEDPGLKLRRIMTTQLAEAPQGAKQFGMVIKSPIFKRNEVQRYLRMAGLTKVPLKTFPHHVSHAASTFYPSGFRDSAILVLDGVGEWATSSIYRGRGQDIHPKMQQNFPHSVGLLYAAITAFCGFKVNSGEYKLMGLAPYGQPIYSNKIKTDVVRIHDDGSTLLNLDFFDFTRGVGMYSSKLSEFLGLLPRAPDETITEAHCNLAASIQDVLNQIYVANARHALRITQCDKLCLAGGVALNCVANNHLLALLPPSQIFIQPAAGDAGGAVGAALLANKVATKDCYNWRPSPLRHVMIGTSYTDSSIQSTLDHYSLVYETFPSGLEMCKSVAALLANGQVVGWFQGAMEFGPRALGGRSILADPRDPNMQAHLNLAIKNRESFRPFAPAILSEHVSQLVEWPQGASSPYMLFTAYLRENLRKTQRSYSWPKSGNLNDALSQRRSTIPAVTHVDFSMRFQSVEEGSPLRQLLEQFYIQTGCPVIANTSFNVRGEPIVESPSDALMGFSCTAMDVLAIGRFVVMKKAQDSSVINQLIASRVQFAPD